MDVNTTSRKRIVLWIRGSCRGLRARGGCGLRCVTTGQTATSKDQAASGSFFRLGSAEPERHCYLTISFGHSRRWKRAHAGLVVGTSVLTARKGSRSWGQWLLLGTEELRTVAGTGRENR